MSKIKFPNGFIWGAATASYQIEGASTEDGKGESIWDRFSHIPGKVSDGTSGDVSSDHYHLFEQDVKLMKELGLQAYRLSVSWPRVLPEGTGRVNEKGLDFYRKLIDLLVENKIKIAVTLYHWDLPQALQDIGGWANRKVTDYFEEYARILYKAFGNKVDFWITHNEPSVVSYIGNWNGAHAPGITDYSTALLVSHHLLLSHGKAVKAFYEMGLKGEIGITLNMSNFSPKTDSEEDLFAAQRASGYWNRWFIDPILKKKYPADMLEWYKGKVIIPDITDEDMNIISQPIDFIGLNNYFGTYASYDKSLWPLYVKEDFIGDKYTEMGWGINPEEFYKLIMKLHNNYNHIKIYITENGAAFDDVIDKDGQIQDDDRVDYLSKHIAAVHKAIQDGANVAGYFAWSLMDNFEWALGYEKRFGIVYIDYASQKRIIKKSGHWYKQVISDNGLI